MKIGIMQPYFFPYIGYWQLINQVDQYVIFDDVNYINRGWINRNRILINNKPTYFNLPCLGLSQNKLINQISINPDNKEISKKLRQLSLAYKKAPFYDVVYPMIEGIMTSDIFNLSEFLFNSIKVVNKYLGIDTNLILSSNLKNNKQLSGQEKIIDICKLLNATEYFNAIGGKCLYSTERFNKENIELKFLCTNDSIRYKQFDEKYYSNLSIIDMMMFCSTDTISCFLNEYQLVTD